MALTDFTKTRSEKKADKKTRKKEEDEARSRFEDPQKIISQMKLKERPSYGQPTSAQQRYSDQTSRAASDRDKRKSSRELQNRAAATKESYRAHLPEKSK